MQGAGKGEALPGVVVRDAALSQLLLLMWRMHGLNAEFPDAGGAEASAPCSPRCAVLRCAVALPPVFCLRSFELYTVGWWHLCPAWPDHAR